MFVWEKFPLFFRGVRQLLWRLERERACLELGDPSACRIQSVVETIRDHHAERTDAPMASNGLI
jgi:hypothetical protein